MTNSYLIEINGLLIGALGGSEAPVRISEEAGGALLWLKLEGPPCELGGPLTSRKISKLASREENKK